jgi:hypothetical protein
MTKVNVLATITKVYSDLKHSDQPELALPLEFIYKRFEKATNSEKQRVYSDFTKYCQDYDIEITYVSAELKKVA